MKLDRIGTALLVALLAASRALAATEPLTIQPSQDSLVLGRVRALPVTIEIAGNMPAASLSLEVRANVGRVSELAPVGKNRYLALYEPPRERYPRVAVLVATLRSGEQAWHARADIELLGEASLQIQTLAGSEITVDCAARRYGPLLVGPSGVLSLRLEEVPPSTKSYVIKARSAVGRVATHDQALLVPPLPALTVGPVITVASELAEFALAPAQRTAAGGVTCASSASVRPGQSGLAIVRASSSLVTRGLECRDQQGAKVVVRADKAVPPLAPIDESVTVAAPIQQVDLSMDPSADRTAGLSLGAYADSRGGIGPALSLSVASGGGTWSLLADLTIARGAGEHEHPEHVVIAGEPAPWHTSVTAAVLHSTTVVPTASLALGLGLGGHATYTVVGSEAGRGATGELAPHAAALARLSLAIAPPWLIDVSLRADVAPPVPEVGWRASGLVLVGVRRGWYFDTSAAP